MAACHFSGMHLLYGVLISIPLNMKLDDVLSESLEKFLLDIAGITRYAGNFFRQFYRPPYEFRETLNQAYRLGFNSLFLVSITGFIIGLVMTLQMKPTMAKFGAESWLPSMIAIAIIREIGPVLTALICAGKMASGIGAELGSMKVTEQIDAMTVSGVNPFKYLIVTRVVATTLALPLLVFYTDAIAMVGSYIGVNLGGNMSTVLFFNSSLGSLSFSDVMPATLKSFMFGFAIGIVGCYRGFNAQKGTIGVGEAANSAVVISSVFIFIIDLIVVQFSQFFV